jgi:hypothetical protein
MEGDHIDRSTAESIRNLAYKKRCLQTTLDNLLPKLSFDEIQVDAAERGCAESRE